MRTKYIFLLLIVIYFVLIGKVNATNNVYIISGEIKNDSDEIIGFDPLFYLGSGYSEDNGSITSNYSVLFYNNSNLIKIFNFSIEYFEGIDKIFFFSVDIPNETNIIKFKNQSDIIKIFNISQNAPLISELNIENISEDAYNVSWSASDVDGDNLTHSIYISLDNKITWDLLVLDINETSEILNFSFFPGANYSIKLVASDGFNWVEKIYDENLTILNKPPYVFISLPNPDSIFSNSTNISNITFEGWAYDPEIGELNNSFSFKWYSNINGFIGNGTSFVYGNLSVGNHTITLNVSEDIGNNGTESINITVTNETKPDVSITNISFYPQEPYAGENLYIIVTVHNIITDASFNISFYDGNPDQGGTLIDSGEGYAYANELTSNFGLWIPSTPENHSIYIVISNSTPAESNENNNKANTTVYINPKPVINSVSISPYTAGFGEDVTITANITAWNASIDKVLLGISPPNLSETNYTMSNIGGNIWQYNYKNWINGTYNYTVYVNDSNGLTDSSSGTFEMYVNLSISIQTLKDSYIPGEFVNITDPPDETSAEEIEIGTNIIERGSYYDIYKNPDGSFTSYIYSGEVNILDNGKYKPFTDVVSFVYENGIFYLTWQGNNIEIEPYMLVNSEKLTFSELNDIYPNTKKEIIIDKERGGYHYAINLSSLDDSIFINNVGFLIKNSNLNADILNDKIIFDNIELSFKDLTEHNFDLEINSTDILVSNLENKIKDGNLYLDPIIQLTAGDIIEDGYIEYDRSSAYTRNKTKIVAHAGGYDEPPSDYRAYFEFNTSSIDDSATINKVIFRVYVDGSAAGIPNDLCELRQIEAKVGIQSNNNLYADIGNGTTYNANLECGFEDTKWINATLNNAITDLKNQLSNDWFAVGIRNADGEGQVIQRPEFYTFESVKDPVLIVNYTLPFKIEFKSPTPQNGLTTLNTNIEINVSIIAEKLKEMKFNWNSTNLTFYDDSLVLMYNFNNLSALGENNSYIIDLSKYGNYGTAELGANPTIRGKYSGAFEFDGYNDMITALDSDSLDIIQGITLEAWIYRKGNGDYIQEIIKKDNNYILRLENTTLYFYYWNATNYLYAWAGNILNNQWYHVIGTADSPILDNLKLYINGEEQDVSRNSYINSRYFGSILEIGDRSSNDESFYGTIDEVRVWNRSLTSEEIKQHYYSNLYEYDINKWALYIEQSNLSGIYTYFASAKDTAGNDNMTEIRIFYANMTESKIVNNGPTNVSIYLLMKIQYWNGSSWLDQSTRYYSQVPIDINVSNILKLDQYWNSWNTSENTYGNGTYRVWAAVVDSENVTLINRDGSKIEAYYNFTLNV